MRSPKSLQKSRQKGKNSKVTGSTSWDKGSKYKGLLLEAVVHRFAPGEVFRVVFCVIYYNHIFNTSMDRGLDTGGSDILH